MTDLPETLVLGRHAYAVLTSYGIGLGLIAALIAQSLLAARRARRALEAEESGARSHG